MELLSFRSSNTCISYRTQTQQASNRVNRGTHPQWTTSTGVNQKMKLQVSNRGRLWHVTWCTNRNLTSRKALANGRKCFTPGTLRSLSRGSSLYTTPAIIHMQCLQPTYRVHRTILWYTRFQIRIKILSEYPL